MQEIDTYQDFEKLMERGDYLVNDKIHIFKDCHFNFEFTPVNKSFELGLSFKNCHFKKIYIKGCEFFDSFTLMDCYANSAWFLDCNFHKLSSIHLLKYDGSGDIHNGHLILNGCQFTEHSRVSSSRVTISKTQGLLSIGHPNKILPIEYVSVNEFNGEFGLVGVGVNSLTQEPVWPTINHLSITGNFEGKMFVHRVQINKVDITRLHTKGGIRFDMVKVDSFCISDFNNMTDCGLQLGRLSPLSDSSEIKIVSSNLGKAYISSCDFSKFNQFIYFDSDLSQVVSNNTRWAEVILTNEDRELSKNDYGEIKNITCLDNKENYYRAVKNILKSSGEKLGESVFRSHELNVRLQNTNWAKGEVLNKISLCASKAFSEHGTNWFKPILFMVIINYSIFLFFNSIEGVSIGIPEFLQLFNPAHRLESFESHSLIKKSHLVILDFLSRISSSYLIFQSIKAFRKFI